MKIILLVVSCAIGGTLSAIVKKYTATSEVPIPRAPFFVTIFRNWEPECGGALIHVAHIITAAHCVVDGLLQKYSNITVEGGTDRFRQRSSSYEVEDVVPAPGYTSGNLLDDIAVVTLSRRVRFEDFLTLPIIGLPRADLKYGESAKVIGFEHKTPPDGASLREIHVVIRSADSCVANESCEYIDFSNKFCAVNDDATKLFPSNEDGIPLVYDGNVVGISSARSRRNTLRYYYTNVREFVPFIKSVIGENSKDWSQNV